MRCPSCKAENADTVEICFKCGRALGALTEGSVVSGRYEIVTPLGKGGMGMVYKAHDRDLDEIVALKLLRTDLANDPVHAKRFRSEIKLARRVTHRNVCRIHELLKDGHFNYIVMEYVEGLDLRQELRQNGPYPPERAVETAIQIAAGLGAVHQAGIVHRDLKTANVIRSSSGVVKLMDFGIAKNVIAESTNGATATGHIVGTPEYMSPEQIRGAQTDARSDIYALGIVMFELFTGRVPFRSDTPLLTLMKHLNEPPPLTEPEAARIPAPVIPILSKALAKDPADRHATTAELIEELGRALKLVREASAAAPAPAGPVPTKHAAVPALEPRSTPTPAPTPVPTAVPTLIPTAAMRPRLAPVVSPGLPVTGLVATGVAIAVVVASVVAYRTWASARPITVAAIDVATPGSVPSLAATPEITPQTPSPESSPSPPSSAEPRPRPTVPGTLRSVSLAAKPVAPLPSPSSGIAFATTTPTTSVPASIQAPEPAGSPSEAPPVPTTAAPPAVVQNIAPDPPPVPPAAPGKLVLKVKPKSELVLDGRVVGMVGSQEIQLSPGQHAIVLNHPDFEPFRRLVEIHSGRSVSLTVNLPDQGIRRSK